MPEAAQQYLSPGFHQGTSPLLISVPHAGTGISPGLSDRFTSQAAALPDTDWFVERLYAFALDYGASMLVARPSRLVVDLNRPSDDQPLYDTSQTQLMTGVLPRQCFSGEAVYLPGQEPDAEETLARIRMYWQPYHDQLAACLQNLKQVHGHAVVLDAHSIRGEVPMLFEGVLPDLNLGSNGGASAHPSLLQTAREALTCEHYSLVVDGRFKGGYITRNYGNPANGIHALQLEISQRTYMQEHPPAWRDDLARELQARLEPLVTALTHWRPGNA
jgi:N-formylglutamate amidohydrolase